MCVSSFFYRRSYQICYFPSSNHTNNPVPSSNCSQTLTPFFLTIEVSQSQYLFYVFVFAFLICWILYDRPQMLFGSKITIRQLQTYKLLMGVATTNICCSPNISQINTADTSELLRFFWQIVHNTPNVLTENYKTSQMHFIQQKFDSLCQKSYQKATLNLFSPKNIHIFHRFDSFVCAGQVSNGYLQGKGVVAFPNNKAYIGHFESGRFSEQGEFRFFGSLKSRKVQVRVETVRDQKQIQLSIQILGSKSEILATMSNAKLESKQHRYIKYHNLDEYIGQWKNGMPHGEGRYVYKNGQQNACFPYYQGTFVKGQRQGTGTLYYDSGKWLRITWSEGKPFGYGELVVNGYREQVLFNGGQRVYQKISGIDPF